MLRPDTYIGSMEPLKELMWIYKKETITNDSSETVTKGKMIQKKIQYVPGLYKIFDEILVNAANNKQRDEKMSCIRIDINPETNTISIWNNSQGIPVFMHKDEEMFVPTMIFGKLEKNTNNNTKLCNI